jgi:hypothetical protein
MDVQARQVRARIALARGAPTAAAEAGEALKLARDAKDPQVLYPALAFAAREASFTGRMKEAATLIDQLLTLWDSRPKTVLQSHLQSFSDAAEALSALGRGEELAEVGASARMQTRWIEAATAFIGGDFQRAADIYAECGSLPDEAFARLRGAEALIREGRLAQGDEQLLPALAFYRSVGATAYLREGEALLARTA